ncbi:hypothetical protein [Actinobaculum suis]|uniref:hypothetical protein n=1 Tax=Actinobaculum suis TaxID=1657 RepID=UPI000808689F|nr:hypothetical protein [Actinobaculum suis]OCA94868.1 hypothetical protein ACU20_05740 [Actinobaculum suis]OCA95456.1 hypothetical protein ACU21_03960 [Actinobaculum suis]
MKRFIAGLVAMLLPLGLTAGCVKGGGDAGPATSDPAAPVTTTPSAPSAPAADGFSWAGEPREIWRWNAGAAGSEPASTDAASALPGLQYVRVSADQKYLEVWDGSGDYAVIDPKTGEPVTGAEHIAGAEQATGAGQSAGGEQIAGAGQSAGGEQKAGAELANNSAPKPASNGAAEDLQLPANDAAAAALAGKERIWRLREGGCIVVAPVATEPGGEEKQGAQAPGWYLARFDQDGGEARFRVESGAATLRAAAFNAGSQQVMVIDKADPDAEGQSKWHLYDAKTGDQVAEGEISFAANKSIVPVVGGFWIPSNGFYIEESGKTGKTEKNNASEVLVAVNEEQEPAISIYDGFQAASDFLADPDIRDKHLAIDISSSEAITYAPDEPVAPSREVSFSSWRYKVPIPDADKLPDPQQMQFVVKQAPRDFHGFTYTVAPKPGSVAGSGNADSAAREVPTDDASGNTNSAPASSKAGSKAGGPANGVAGTVRYWQVGKGGHIAWSLPGNEVYFAGGHMIIRNGDELIGYTNAQ